MNWARSIFSTFWIVFSLSVTGGLAAQATAEAPPFTWSLDEVAPEEPGSDFLLPDGSRFYLEVVNQNYRAIFFQTEPDAEGRERVTIPPPHSTLILRGEETANRRQKFHHALTSNGTYLTSPRLINPPHDIYVVVVAPEEDGPGLVVPHRRFIQR